MVWSFSAARGYSLHATDGALGMLSDLLFDDVDWVVRYFVADTSRWLPGRRVLIAPGVVGRPEDREFKVALTTEQVRNAPGLETHEPVSRQHEEELAGHYGWSTWWENPVGLGLHQELARRRDGEERQRDPHLRSIDEVIGYAVGARDGQSVGHVEDVLIDQDGWTIRWLIVDTRDWLPGKKVVIAPDWVSGVLWHDRTVAVDLSPEEIKDSPEYRTGEGRDWEESLFRHYGRRPYWI